MDEYAWLAWTPEHLSQRLQQLARPWCVVGGWALDLWHGQQTREHSDLEFTVRREDFPLFRQTLSELKFYTVKNGAFECLPEHVLPGDDIFQVWGFDTEANAWRVDVMLEAGSAQSWVYKRDTSIVYPRAEMVALSASGIPYLRPAATLLFKAKNTRPKDQGDFTRALPNLSGEDRQWLVDHLQRLHPQHEWIANLTH